MESQLYRFFSPLRPAEAGEIEWRLEFVAARSAVDDTEVSYLVTAEIILAVGSPT